MKHISTLAALSLCALLAACTTSSTTTATHDAAGNVVSSSTTTSHVNHPVEAVTKAGTAIKEGVVSSYNWMKENARRAEDPKPAQSPASPSTTLFTVSTGDSEAPEAYAAPAPESYAAPAPVPYVTPSAITAPEASVQPLAQ